MSTNPPDGWSFETASGGSVAWGTDADISTAVTNTIGSTVVEMKNTTPTGVPHLVTDGAHYFDVEEGMPYLLRAVVNGSRASAGDTVWVGMAFYTGAGAYVSASTVHAAVLPATSSWIELSGVLVVPSTARKAAVYVTKAATNFTLYIDEVLPSRFPRCFSAYLGGLSSYSDTDDIEFGSEDYDYGSIYDTSSYYLKVPKTGIYSLAAGAQTTDLLAGEYFQLSIIASSTSTVAVTRNYCHTSGDSVVVTVSNPATLLTRGETVKVFVGTDGGSIGLPGGSRSVTWFAGCEIF